MSASPAFQGKFELQAGDLPLVSVIIVNYNYGRYLSQAIQSVLAQSYTNIECIIVDNASTDDSLGVLKEFAEGHPELKLILRRQNGGQSIASVEGFEASTGEYVIFLDADDYLLPACIETHIFVHLSLRIAVGLSSGDMFQASGSHLVLGTIPALSNFIRSDKGLIPHLLRPINDGGSDIWASKAALDQLGQKVHYVAPNVLDTWVWPPTSANCYRRNALELFLSNPRLKELRSCTDSYLLRGVSVLTGSVLIDRPVAVYRLHGSNIFSRHPHLNGILSYDRRNPGNDDQAGRKLVIAFLIENHKFFLNKLESEQQFFEALKTLHAEWPDLPSKINGCQSYTGEVLLNHFETLARNISTYTLMRHLFAFRVSIFAITRAYFQFRRRGRNI